MTNVTLTTEQAQQIEEALEDIVRVFKFETGTPVEALAVIRAARAREQAEQGPIKYLMEVTCSKCGTTESGVLKFKTPQPVQEPRAWNDLTEDDMKEIAKATLGHCNRDVYEAVVTYFKGKNPLYAAPVRTKDLTVDEKVALADRLNLNGRIVVIDAVIAADREKNK